MFFPPALYRAIPAAPISAALLVLIMLFAGRASLASEPATEPVPAKVAAVPVTVQSVSPLQPVAASLRAKRQADIAPRVTGVISQLPVTLGSQVKRGELLVRIDAGEIEARRARTAARLAQARRNLEREQRLLSEEASTRETVRTMTDQLRIAQAEDNEARALADATAITAPFSGKIIRKEVEVGDLAAPGRVLLELEGEDRLQARADVPESLAPQLAVGHTLTVQVPGAGAEVQGVITEMSPAADPASRTVRVVLDLPPHPLLRGGQFARLLLPGDPSPALMIPDSAIMAWGQMERVFVVRDNRAELRLVRSGNRQGNMTEILSGLNAEDIVIISNNRLLADGQPVRVLP
ncbi:MAG: efflux RND transporter periplasmic adaptor subunit [Desulfobulbus sp.]